MSIVDQNLPAAPPRKPPFHLRVRLAREFLTSFAGRFAIRSDNATLLGGLLLGTARDGLVIVERFEESKAWEPGSPPQGAEMESAHAKVVRELESKKLQSTQSVIGWYSIRPSGGLAREDVQFHNRHFGKSTDLAIIVRLDQQDPLLEIYGRPPQGLLSGENYRYAMVPLPSLSADTSPVEVAMHSPVRDDLFQKVYGVMDELQRSERARARWRGRDIRRVLRRAFRRPSVFLKGTQSGDGREARAELSAGASTELAKAPSSFEVASPRAPEPSRRTLIGVPVALCLAMLLLFVGARGRGLLSRTADRAAPTEMDLRVEVHGNALLVRWDHRDLPSSGNAGGVLEINDGARRARLRLNEQELSQGSVLYQPASPDVTFRLELAGEPSSPVVRFVNGKGAS